MSDYDFNFGPPWFWKVLAGLCGLGALTVLGGIVWLICWLVKHLYWN